MKNFTYCIGLFLALFVCSINVQAQCTSTGENCPENLEANTYDASLSNPANENYNRAAAGDTFFLRSNVAEPWAFQTPSYSENMDSAFGAGNWTQEFYETLDVATVFASTTRFVYMEGSDSNASELSAFLMTNIATIENWVSNGGSLLLNAAPNEGGNIDFGFGGTTLTYPNFSSSVVAAAPGHPAFIGPNTPTTTSMTGSSYAHASIAGTGYTNIIVDQGNASQVILAEKAFGNGNVMVGGMTKAGFHSPNPEAINFKVNLLVYLESIATTDSPIITCPSDIQADNTPGMCSAPVFFGDPIAVDPNGGTVTITQTMGPVSGSDFPVGDTIVEFTATNDEAPNETSTCQFVVTVNDVDGPSMTCPANITTDNDMGVCGAVVTYDPPTVTDNCPEDPAGLVQTAGLASGETFPVGTTTNTFVYTDSGGNTATCSFDVTVNDVEAPAAPVCIDMTVDLDTNGMVTVNAEDLVDMASLMDNCGPITVTAASGGVAPGSLSTIYEGGNGGATGGAVYFDITVGDADINVSSIDINTGEGGAFTMDVYTEVGTYAGNEANPTFWGTADATASGTGAGANLPSNAVLDAAVTLSANTTYAMALVLDGSHAFDYTNGNGSNETYSNDDITLTLGSATNAPFTDPTFAPRVFNGGINYEFEAAADTTITFDCANLGDNVVTVIATDASGNSNFCTATVTVNDVTAPVLVCQNITVELDENGEATVVAEDLIDSAATFDACGIEVLTMDIDGNFTCDDIGNTFTAQVFASDASNNAATCMAEITVVDMTAPVITCPENQEAEIDQTTGTYTFPDYFAIGEATALDNCTEEGSIVTTQDPAPGFESGVTPNDPVTVTLTSTDASGNTSTCSFEVNVVVEILGVQENELSSAITMYPNPATSQVMIANSSTMSLQKAMIFDISGKMIQTIDLRNMQSEQTINISQLASGIYMVQIASENAMTVKRLIKK